LFGSHRREYSPFLNSQKIKKMKRIYSSFQKIRIANQAAEFKEDELSKTLLANERMLLSWMNLIIYIFTVAILLLNSHHSFGRTCGYVSMMIAVAFSVFSIYQFRWRMASILEKKPFGDPWKTWLVALLFVLMISFLAMAVFVWLIWFADTGPLIDP